MKLFAKILGVLGAALTLVSGNVTGKSGAWTPILAGGGQLLTAAGIAIASETSASKPSGTK